MSKYLYFASSRFASNKDIAHWMSQELMNKGITVGESMDNDYMFIIPIKIERASLNIYVGKNDEDCDPPLWQAWPEMKIGLFKKLVGAVDRTAQEKTCSILSDIVGNLDGVSSVEWSNI